MLSLRHIMLGILLVALPVRADLTTMTTNITNMDLMLDVGYFVLVDNQQPLSLRPATDPTEPYRTFAGCRNTLVTCNFPMEMTGRINTTSAVGGNWTVSVTPNTMPPGANDVRICVKATGVELENLPGGARSYKVAELILAVTPAIN